MHYGGTFDAQQRRTDRDRLTSSDVDLRDRAGVRAFEFDDSLFGFEVHDHLAGGDNVPRFDFDLGDIDGLHTVGNFGQFEFNGH